MCVQGIVMEAICKHLSFSIHCPDAAQVLKIEKAFRRADVYVLFIIGVPVVQQKYENWYESKVRSRIL